MYRHANLSILPQTWCIGTNRNKELQLHLQQASATAARKGRARGKGEQAPQQSPFCHRFTWFHPVTNCLQIENRRKSVVKVWQQQNRGPKTLVKQGFLTLVVDLRGTARYVNMWKIKHKKVFSPLIEDVKCKKQTHSDTRVNESQKKVCEKVCEAGASRRWTEGESKARKTSAKRKI